MDCTKTKLIYDTLYFTVSDAFPNDFYESGGNA